MTSPDNKNKYSMDDRRRTRYLMYQGLPCFQALVDILLTEMFVYQEIANQFPPDDAVMLDCSFSKASTDILCTLTAGPQD
ncbi:hypothetical protein AVEN_77068-1 [Araneus ventricosus]|uniref:Uncharacterized protein n=1 Tax=Araneus ventricosus TaxID=182803 RepID=A0A4Y2G797_ARAVE|nr:hypothetical protein AVEN_77068-1 [Araneus ventricosus]